MTKQSTIYQMPKAIAMTPCHFTLQLNGAVVPKSRPRVTSNGTYMPRRYRDWKQGAILDILSQVSSVRVALPIAKASICVQVQGRHRGDADNVAGALLDTLVEAGILRDDRLTCVPELYVFHEPNLPSGAMIGIVLMEK